MISSTLRIISAASVADKTTCALTCMSHQHHLTGIAQTVRLEMQVHHSKCGFLKPTRPWPGPGHLMMLLPKES